MDPINIKKSEQPSSLLLEKIKIPEQAPRPSTPEATIEISKTKEGEKEIKEKEGFLDETIDNLKQTLRKTKKKPSVIPQVKDEMTLQIENIMEDGLQDVYKAMSAVQQQEFKIKGEKTAWEIRQLLRSGHVKIKKIFKLLLEWLKTLPGINKFFLEQEAKIKADKIIALQKIHDNNQK